ncbi:ArnT family glycosyltransferase [Cellulomonas triticagri]|uniref:Glycosyltransferase RgtA/B/C/D-like domain-containing protein n=1 Tax=Cellulomonas triticagri TaxID=2483352 RepID=A0A3M2IXK9_9CELL|nr:glycosyltransferase family 39 protein [Cellulomonas triticagri]RMI06657.1 hypothetical protein EBM89_15670 [Cellulomonas triticagri]
MTTTLPRPAPHAPAAPTPDRVPERAARARRRHRLVDLAWLAPALLLSAVVQLVNLGGSPQRIDDEGTYTAQAWSIGALGELTHYTYWYDHPPVGWMQIAAWTGLTGAFDRYDEAVIAGREAMVAATLVSATLLWFLGRRLRLSRPAATAAVLVFALSPLALQFHRSVYLDNVATPWLLGAILLATARRNQLAAHAGAAAALGVAVLSKETYLLALPIVAYLMWRHAAPSTRRYTLTVATTVLVLIGGSYLVLATVKGELVPGADRVSLVDGIMFQLADRESSGSALDSGSLLSRTLQQWWQLDPVLIVAGLAAAVAGLGIRRLRPFAIAMLALTAVVLRPGGYVPVPYVIVLLPFAALLLAGVTDVAVRRFRRPTRHRTTGLRTTGRLATARRGLGRTASAAWVAAVVAALVVATPLWGAQLRGFLRADLDQPMRQAQSWLEDNVGRDATLVVDDAMWVDLVRAGFPRENVLWYYKVDTDPAVAAGLPDGWRDVDYVVTTDSMRTFPTAFPQVSETIANSVVVASFGEGSTQVDVRAVDPEGLEHAEDTAAASREARAAAGADLVRNPRLTLQGDSRALLEAGMVDSRIVLALATRLLTADVTVADFPVSVGEGDAVRRQVLVADAASGTDGTAWLDRLGGASAPLDVRTTGDGVLATFSAHEPAGLLAGVG